MRAYQITAPLLALALAGPAAAATLTTSVTGSGAGPFELHLTQPPAVDPVRGPVLGVTWTFTLSATIDGTVQNFFSMGNNTLEELTVGLRARNLSGVPGTVTSSEILVSGDSGITPLTLAVGDPATFTNVTAVYRESGIVSEGDLLSWVDGTTVLTGDIVFFSTIVNDGGVFGVTDREFDWTARLDATYAYIPVPASGVLLGTAMALVLGAGVFRRRRG
ncbi:hypothetical protein [Rhodobaculum claviforme]|uniref:VPLPA-CTERM protein sorting domain-containing protein n=1 Tax=Rhodobaculum claviforme TaxID=1549854 RepID=A0A934TMU1_9RHOB|nr:hypothetical protein [Rhodobaculum claviforme]MBK5928077.1 hypothetical protein [Rhodobaculum claviforme]